MLLAGVQREYQLAARSTDPIVTLREVPRGQPLQFIVQAVNGSMEGVASDPVVVTPPLPEMLAAHAAG